MAPEVYRPSEADRRPLASRSWKMSGWAAHQLAIRNVSANSISVAGMVCGVLAGYCFAATDQVSIPAVAWIAGGVLVQARLLANLLDGMVAIESGKASRVGELFNEVPDRVSDAAIFIGLGHAAGGLPWLGDLAAVLALFVAYVRAAARIAGAPQDYAGPMAKQHRMFLVTVLALLSAFVPADQPEHWLGMEVGWTSLVLGLIVVGCVLTAIRRLLRAGHFLTTGEATKPSPTIDGGIQA